MKINHTILKVICATCLLAIGLGAGLKLNHESLHTKSTKVDFNNGELLDSIIALNLEKEFPPPSKNNFLDNFSSEIDTKWKVDLNFIPTERDLILGINKPDYGLYVF